MDLQEKVTALEAEKKQYLQIIDHVNAEKLAIDQMYVLSLKDALNYRKEVILKDKQISDLNEQIRSINEDKAILIKELEGLKDTLAMMASNAQH